MVQDRLLRGQYRIMSQNELNNNRNAIALSPLVECSTDGLKTKFVFGLMSQGLGYVIGTALRRMILNYSIGVTPVCIKVDGVSNEFAPISGVREDTPQIIAALRRMPVHTNAVFNGTEMISIKAAKGSQRDITCADLVHTQLVFPVKDFVVLRVTGSEDVNMSVWFACGRGAKTLEDIDFKEFGVGAMRISPFCKPVISVSVDVKAETKTGVMYDQLELVVETDGARDVVEIMQEAIDNLCSSINQLKEVSFITAGEAGFTDDLESYMSKPISALTLNLAVLQCLENAGFETVGSVVNAGKQALLGIDSITDAILERIEFALRTLHPRLQIKS